MKESRDYDVDFDNDYVNDGGSLDNKPKQQPKTFHDFVFSKGNAERIWKIADKIAELDLDYFLQHIGRGKTEAESNYNAAKYFKEILIDEENDIISNEQRKNIKSRQKSDIYDADNLDQDVNHDYDEIFGTENNNELGKGNTVDKLIFTESWYNKTREYCRSGNSTPKENGNKLKSYLSELLKCMIIVDILSMEKDDSAKDLISASGDFESNITNYLLNESNIKRRLRFFASKYDGGNSGHRGITQLVAQFCQKYLAYRLNDQKVSVDKDKNEELVDDSDDSDDSADWVKDNRIAIISFVKCHIDRLMNHNKVATKIQLSVSNNVTGNLLQDDDYYCTEMKDNGECIITSSQLASQLKETDEFEEYFLYAENGINLPSLGVDFNDFCKIISDHKFDDMDEGENGIQHLCKTMSLDKFVVLFITWKELDFDDKNNDASGDAYENVKSHLYESDYNKLSYRIETINKYLSQENKLGIDEVKKVIDEKTKTGSKINNTELLTNLTKQNSILLQNMYDFTNDFFADEDDKNNKSETIQFSESNVTNKKKLFKNIWFWRFLSLAATVLNFILMIAFINVWFYFIAPLVIFVVLTVVLFIYKPTSENKFKKGLGGVGGSVPFSNNQDKVIREQYPDLQNEQTILSNE